jgi:hypothetical protein
MSSSGEARCGDRVCGRQDEANRRFRDVPDLLDREEVYLATDAARSGNRVNRARRMLSRGGWLRLMARPTWRSK